MVIRRWNKISNLLIAPIPEAIYLDNLSMCVCHRRFSSINIPSDFIEVTFSIGTLSIESSGWLDNSYHKFSFSSVQSKFVGNKPFV